MPKYLVEIILIVEAENPRSKKNRRLHHRPTHTKQENRKQNRNHEV